MCVMGINKRLIKSHSWWLLTVDHGVCFVGYEDKTENLRGKNCRFLVSTLINKPSKR